jgi:hypothetical protein
MGKRKVRKESDKAARGEALAYLVGKLLEVERAEWHYREEVIPALNHVGKLLEVERAEWYYREEVIPALNHAAEQRAADRHSIQTTLEEGDWRAIVKLARAFQAGVPCTNYFADDAPLSVCGDIPF